MQEFLAIASLISLMPAYCVGREAAILIDGSWSLRRHLQLGLGYIGSWYAFFGLLWMAFHLPSGIAGQLCLLAAIALALINVLLGLWALLLSGIKHVMLLVGWRDLVLEIESRTPAVDLQHSELTQDSRHALPT